MIRTAAIVAVALSHIIALAGTTAQAEPARPALKRSAVVSGDLVRIGDLIENAGIVADVAIFRAPDLGEAGTVRATSVIEAVRAHAIIGLDTRGITEVTVTRPSRTISGKEVEREIAALLAERYGLGEAADVAVTFERELRTLNIEPTAAAKPHVLHLRYDTHNTRFDALLEFSGMRPLRFTGTAVATVAAVTMIRSVARGDIIRSADVAIERRPKRQAGRDILKSTTEAVGHAARQALRAGQVLRNDDVMRPALVQRDAAVTLVYRVPGVMLTVRGKANESGSEGDLVTATNLQSKRVVQGTVAGDGSIIVGGHGPRIIANLEPSAPDAQ
ncbi:MAG TPA: flagellar basal body P-ring formation chaperone FlgA [Pseudolabrys sp.]|nr:flagellar basal body P-ring formation chaperone FlgA [Pseudolabrys sp.]